MVIFFKNKNILGQDQRVALGDSETDWILRSKTVPPHAALHGGPKGRSPKETFSWTEAACPSLPASNTAFGGGFHPQLLWTVRFEQ